jgi:hypothetical protein
MDLHLGNVEFDPCSHPVHGNADLTHARHFTGSAHTTGQIYDNICQTASISILGADSLLEDGLFP